MHSAPFQYSSKEDAVTLQLEEAPFCTQHSVAAKAPEHSTGTIILCFFHYSLDNEVVFQLLNVRTSSYMLKCQEILIETRSN